jgi:MoaA/NifB/PqqE/SkfB family radical SAM enzyme
VWHKRGNFFNLYEKIYKKNEEFKDFQIVVVVPKGQEEDVDRLTTNLKKLGTISGWSFVFLDDNQIKEFYASLKLQNKLDETLGSNEVYIVDKKLNLRGRKGKSVKGDVEYREGYNTQMVSELHNEMTDDVKIILAEYRLALKKNHNASRQI